MRKRITFAVKIALVAVSASDASCARLPTNQLELERVHWIPALQEIILAGDFSDYTNVSKHLNLDLAAKSPMPVKDSDGTITGESFDVETVPLATKLSRRKINFYYGVYTPTDRSFRRVILIINNLSFHNCITEPDIFGAFGQTRKTTYAHSPLYSIDYHFKGGNDIDLLFRFKNSSGKCADEINIFQNRRK